MQYNLIYNVFSNCTNVCGITGNVSNSVGDFGPTFFSDDSVKIGEWHNIAVYYDQKYIVTYIDGVPSRAFPYTDGRMTPNLWETVMYVGGSDHSNFNGLIAKIRGFENTTPFNENGDQGGGFKPELNYRGSIWNGTNIAANFLVDYTKPANTIADLSSGLEGVRHPGYRNRGADTGLFDTRNDYVEAALPQWVVSPITRPITSLTVPNIPLGAVVYDSFNRNDVTRSWDSTLGLGNTQGGSAGVKAWETSTGAGILSGRAFIVPNISGSFPTVETGIQNQKVCIDVSGSKTYNASVRAHFLNVNNYWEASISASNNYLYLYKRYNGSLAEKAAIVSPVTGNGGYPYTLCLENRADNHIKVYVNGSTAIDYQDTSGESWSGTKAGFAAYYGYTRLDNFIVTAATP